MRVAVLVSGSGTNLQALLEVAPQPDSGYEVVLVISDRERVKALERAADAAIPTKVVPWSGDRAGFTTAICDAAEAAGARVLVLAGFMRVLGAEAIRRFPERIVNIHPSLLPAFPGTGAVAQALAYGVKVSGVTVHFVDEEVDHGPIIAQEAVPVLPGDTEQILHARIQETEHWLYPEVVKALVGGRLQVMGRSVLWR